MHQILVHALLSAALLGMAKLEAAEAVSPVRHLTEWFEPAGKTLASLVFRHPSGERGWHSQGFRIVNDSTADLRPYAGLRLDVSLPDDRPVELAVTLSLPEQFGRVAYVPATTAKVVVSGRGAQRVTLPWSIFDFPQAQPAFLKFISRIEQTSRYKDDGKPAPVEYANLAAAMADTIS
jgi:hypothetical protein